MSLYREIYNFFKEEEEKEDGRGRVKTTYPITLSVEGEEDKYLALSAGRIVSLIRTDPEKSNISFDQVEEGEAYKIKKKIKKGPGGYIITSEDADKEITIIVDDKTGDTQQKSRLKKREEPTKQYSRGANVNPEALKSNYEEGSVHKIEFNTLTYSVALRQPFSIYRKISQQEYTDLKTKNNKKVVIFITPEDKPEHYYDVYYVTLPRKARGSRPKNIKGELLPENINYMVYLPKKAIDDLSEKDKKKLKLKLIPLEDIMKGLSILRLTGSVIAKYLSSYPKKKKAFDKIYSKKISKEKEEEPEPLDIDLSFLVSDEEDSVEKGASEKEPPESELEKSVDSGQERKDIAKAKVFLSIDAEEEYRKMLRHYTNKKNAIENKDKNAEKEADKNLIQSVKSFIDMVFDKGSEKLKNPLTTENERDLLIDKVLKDQITKDKKIGLYNNIKTSYDNMKSLNESLLKEQRKLYLLKTKPGSEMDKLFSKSTTAKKNKDVETKKEIPGEYIVGLEDQQARNLSSARSIEQGTISIDSYVEPEKSDDAKKFNDSEEGLYRVKLSVGGSAPKSLELNPKQIMKFVRKSPGSENLNFEDVKEKVYDFERKEGPKVGSIQGSIEILSKNPIGKGDKRKVVTTFRSDTEKEKAKQEKEKAKEEKEKEKAAKAAIKASQPEMKTVRFMGRDIKVPVNYSKDVLKIPMATPSETDLEYKYYLVDFSDTENSPNGRLIRNDKGGPLGTDDRAEAKLIASQIGGDIRVYQRGEMLAKKVNLKEDLTDDDKKNIVSKAVSFKIEADPNDPDAVAEVKGLVKSAKYNKEKKELVLTMDDNSQAMFTGTRSGNVTGVFNPDPTDKLGSVRKINDIQQPLRGVLDKVFPTPAAESKLEAYIRKRIKQALQETEINQYFGVQGPDVKKKRLEEYMKKYEWGFQKSEDPYVRGTGAEKHAIVNKLVHELGDEGVAVYNSYAPKGYEIARPDDLNDMADTPLGSQLYQPYDPNSLTARGGRVAEEDILSRSKYKGSGENSLDSLVKDSKYDKLKAAIKREPNAAAAKGLIDIFRNTSLISKDVKDEVIYQKFKSA